MLSSALLSNTDESGTAGSTLQTNQQTIIHILRGRSDRHFLHLDLSNSNGCAAVAAPVCRTLVAADRSSMSKQ